MNKASNQNYLSLAVSMLWQHSTMSQTGGKQYHQNKNKQHYSRLAKATFWHHHKNADKRANPTQAQ